MASVYVITHCVLMYTVIEDRRLFNDTHPGIKLDLVCDIRVFINR